MRKTGYIAIVGRPNVGKSTLLNAILGEKVSIISNKPQTTRNRITGIQTVGDCQYVFLDTPGMLKPKNPLGDYMAKTADRSMREADAVILVVECGKPISDIEENVIAYLKESGAGALLAINKIDLSTEKNWQKQLPSTQSRTTLTLWCRCAPKRAKISTFCSTSARSFFPSPIGISPRICLPTNPSAR